jgi:hypothetical protein
MSTSSDSNVLLNVASLSMQLSRKYVEPYSHRNSPQKFTQAQLLTCLILRAYLKTTYRGLIEILEVSESLRERIGLQRMPHYSTLKKFADRSSVLDIIDAMLLEIVQQFDDESPEEAAIDSTGMETTSASAHYRTRSGKQRKKYVKLSVCVMAGSLLPSSVVASWGPNNDKAQAPDESVIKPAVHRSDGQQNGKYRSQMTEETLNEKNYGRRWLVESFMSGLKRTTGSALAARSERSLFVEAAIRVLAYALRR